MSIKDDLQHLVDELDEDAASRALVLLHNLRAAVARGDIVREEDIEESRS
jgi:hypothetical protein